MEVVSPQDFLQLVSVEIGLCGIFFADRAADVEKHATDHHFPIHHHPVYIIRMSMNMNPNPKRGGGVTQ